MTLIHRLRMDRRGTVLVETAIAAPFLVLVMLGAFDVSRMVARQTELQEVAAEVASIAMASAPDAQGLATIKTIAVQTANVPTDNVELTQYYRCNSDTTLQTSKTSCSTGAEVSTMLKVRIRSTYTPVWTRFGVGAPVSLDVSRLVQVG